jgi:hypothetical protein
MALIAHGIYFWHLQTEGSIGFAVSLKLCLSIYTCRCFMGTQQVIFTMRSQYDKYRWCLKKSYLAGNKLSPWNVIALFLRITSTFCSWVLHRHTRICTCTIAMALMHAYTHTLTRTLTHTHWLVHLHMHACTHTHTHARMHTQMHAHIHTNTHLFSTPTTHTHTHTHTQMYTHLLSTTTTPTHRHTKYLFTHVS